MIAHCSKSGVLTREIWFDEPVSKRQDIVIGRQRAAYPDGVEATPFHTLAIDLALTPADIFKAFNEATRYEIRRAEKDGGCTSELILKPMPCLDAFLEFYNTFAKGKGLPSADTAQLTRYAEAGHLALSRITQGDEALVWHAYYCAAGRARLLRSAAALRGKDNAQRNLLGRANRLLHWRDIQLFKDAGYRIYDFGGWTSPEDGDPEKQRNIAFYEGFGGHRLSEYNYTYPTSIKGKLATRFRQLKHALFHPRRSKGHIVASTRPHLCIVAADIWPILADDRNFSIAGGMEVQLCILARALVQAGFKVSVVTLNFGQPDGVLIDGITVYRAHKPNEGLPIFRFFHPRITSWWKAMKRADADVYIQRSAAYLTAIVGLFSRHYGRGFIYSGASDFDYKRNQTWQLFQRPGGWRDLQLYKWGLALADGTVAQHRAQVEDCRHWFGREAVEIPNCYLPSDGAKSSRNGVVLWVATVKSLKRPQLFVELARALPHLRFRMVGGPGRGKDAELFRMIKEAAEPLPNLEFVGFVPYAEIDVHFNEARLFVNTSDFEGFPNTFLQAWARGIPTVSFFDCGAMENGRPVGFVCSDQAEMRQVVARLCNDNEEWQDEGQRVRNYFESHHSVDSALAGYTSLIEKVCSPRERAN